MGPLPNLERVIFREANPSDGYTENCLYDILSLDEHIATPDHMDAEDVPSSPSIGTDGDAGSAIVAAKLIDSAGPDTDESTVPPSSTDVHSVPVAVPFVQHSDTVPNSGSGVILAPSSTNAFPHYGSGYLSDASSERDSSAASAAPVYSASSFSSESYNIYDTAPDEAIAEAVACLCEGLADDNELVV
ncbi:hypothetical protein EMMF5_005318 [Cystobasidiomycetes sp. EMM_F5]